MKHLLSASSKLVILEIFLAAERSFISSCELLAFSRTFHKQGTKVPRPTAMQGGLLSHPPILLLIHPACPSLSHRSSEVDFQSCSVCTEEAPEV